jgi:hypothetical protein
VPLFGTARHALRINCVSTVDQLCRADAQPVENEQTLRID